MSKIISIGVLSALFISSAFASLSQNAMKLVPGSKVIEEEKNEVKVRTLAGNVVELEFHPNGTLEEASGSSINDNFVPGGVNKPLKEVVASLQKQGKGVVGGWSFGKHMLKGWRYEFEAIKGGKKVELEVNAKTGEIEDIEKD